MRRVLSVGSSESPPRAGHRLVSQVSHWGYSGAGSGGGFPLDL